MSEQPASPCEGMDKWQFDVVINMPDSTAPKRRQQAQGSVDAFYQGQRAGVFLFGLESDDAIAITRMETYDPYKCRGCATQMRQAVQDAYPDREIGDGGSTNSPVGDTVLNKWREQGHVRNV